MNREEIKQYLKHREPMLLLDTVDLQTEVDAQGNEVVVAYASYYVRGDEFFLRGHFPGNPIVPGVMLCEMASQSACALMVEKVKGKLTLFTGMKNVKFKNPARIGDTIEFTITPLKSLGMFAFVQAEAKVNGTTIMSGEFSYALVSKDAM